jgi:hypothetical protein
VEAIVGLVLLAAVAIAIGAAIDRALTVLELRAKGGTIHHARGRASGELLRELEDVLARTRATGRVRLRIERGQVAVRTEGLDEGTTQRLRNVVGRFPAARLKQAPPMRRVSR